MNISHDPCALFICLKQLRFDYKGPNLFWGGLFRQRVRVRAIATEIGYYFKLYYDCCNNPKYKMRLNDSLTR